MESPQVKGESKVRVNPQAVEQLAQLVNILSAAPVKPRKVRVWIVVRDAEGDVYYDEVPQDGVITVAKVGDSYVFVVEHVDDLVQWIFAASSLEEGLARLAELYEKEEGNVKVLEVEKVEEWE